MPCYSPLRAWRGRVGASGKVSIVWRKSDSFRGVSLDLPCGSCLGCRLERSRQWALRCVHEASLHRENSFVTLTYDPLFVPKGGSLDPEDFKAFIRRAHYELGDFRFFGCGEYGENLGRPHFHILLFGVNFEDRRFWRETSEGKLYRSATLEKLWPYGFSTVGEVSFMSAAYVARYVLKKVTGERAPDHYKGKYPEFIRMSRNPGLGAGWYEKFKRDVFPRDYVICEGKRLAVPKYYFKLLAKESPEMIDDIRRKRAKFHSARAADNDSFRLAVKEKVKLARMKSTVRPLEG